MAILSIEVTLFLNVNRGLSFRKPKDAGASPIFSSSSSPSSISESYLTFLLENKANFFCTLFCNSSIDCEFCTIAFYSSETGTGGATT
jgi:hypothetical protein